MSEDKYPNLTKRRDFFRQASCAAVGTWALKSTIRDLRMINAAMAVNNVSGYKALVCLFLGGGNDSNNWIVPTDSTTIADYTSIRGNLALPQASLLPLYQAGTSGAAYTDAAGHTYGFHPSCPGLQTLFGEDKLAAVMNVGTLVRPTTRAQYTGSNTKFYQPPQLFSHSDQVTQWQTSIPDVPPTTGWGGRVADILNATANPNGDISMSVSLNGANTFEIGNLVAQYHVATTGAIVLTGNGTGSNGGGRLGKNEIRQRALKDILNPPSPHVNLQRTAYADVLDNAIEVGDALNANISATVEVAQGGTWTWNTPFPTNVPGTNTASGLSAQLKMIARLIQARGNALVPEINKFNMARQIFFCSVGGYDTHTSQVLVNGVDDPTNVNGAHYRLLAEVNACMFAFQRAMEQLGVSNNVTTFTASDFSRTLPTNSQGSDHGWGAHHFIMGGAVSGGQTYGTLPTFAINGPNDTGLGRWIPTLAVDQYSATLARWFGLDQNSIESVFPNLTRFSGSYAGGYLGFMA